MTPIPAHLAAYAFYATHQAWTLATYGYARHDPAGAAASRAYLGGADLGCANLGGADLGGANLEGADLSGAHLRGAHLRGATMPDGRVWEEYRQDHLAGICDTPEVRAKALLGWGDHTWKNCPMHHALGVDGPDQIADERKRLLVVAWIALYDGRHLDRPEAA